MRKRTVFRPCERHEPMMAADSRYRRAEIMVEGGYANSPCAGGTCEMLPGRDYYNAAFVAAYPVYRIGDDQQQ